MRLGIVLAVTIATLGLVPAATNCGMESAWTHCDVSNSGTQVDVSAGYNRPGATRPGGGGSDAITPPARPAQPDAVPAEPSCADEDLRCGLVVVAPPDLTLADLVSFRPAAPTLTGEPAGFGVVGMPTNVVAAASEQRIPGTVLGWDVTVRFVPAEFVFEYGDGSSATAATGGASWERLGQAQFSPTATSHVYRDRGTFPVAVTVRYAPSVDFGSGLWRPVPGFVSATSGGYDVRVVEVRTALVDRTCQEDPTGPGC